MKHIAVIGGNALEVVRLTLLKESQNMIVVVDSKQNIAQPTTCFDDRKPFFIRAHNNGSNFTIPLTRTERRKLKRKK